MKKRIISSTLACAMAFGLVACGGSSAPEAGNAGENTQAQGEAQGSEDSGEIFNLKMQIVTFGQEFPGLADVEAAVNAIAGPEIGVNVTLEPIAAWDLPSTSSLAITSNEQIDLMCILPLGSGMDSVANYSTKNMLLPLNDLYAQYGQDIKAAIGELEKIGYTGENMYAVPANYYAGSGASFVALTSEIEALGMSFDESKIYTLSDIEELMAAYKEAKGDGYYSIAGFADGSLTPLLVPTDDLGDTAVGSLMNAGLEDTTVVNKYATEDFAQAYGKTREWFNAGYINPDVISITDAWPTLLQTGQYLGTFTTTNGDGLDGVMVNERSIGKDLTVIRFVEDFATTTSASYGLWAIPVTCGNPEKTMQFLNMMYKDVENSKSIASLLSAGVEGKTYQVVETLEDGRVIIDYVEGVDRMTSPYGGQVPIYGNELKTPKFAPIDEVMFDQIAAYNSNVKYSKAFGYAFDGTNYANQLAAIKNVLATYRAQLEWGTVDVETVLPQFITELENAGMNDVIAANQEQLNAWLSAK